MNETVLFILLSAGVVAVAFTIWFAARSSAAAKTNQTGAQDRPKERPAMPVKPELPQPVLSSSPAPSAPSFPVTAPGTENEGNNVMSLLQNAYEQLKTRQQRIEYEMARIEILRGEREAVAVQVKALDSAMKAFSVSPAADFRRVDQQMLAMVRNGASFATAPDGCHEEVRAEA